jgi:hypothetical protein
VQEGCLDASLWFDTIRRLQPHTQPATNRRDYTSPASHLVPTRPVLLRASRHSPSRAVANTTYTRPCTECTFTPFRLKRRAHLQCPRLIPQTQMLETLGLVDDSNSSIQHIPRYIHTSSPLPRGPRRGTICRTLSHL